MVSSGALFLFPRFLEFRVTVKEAVAAPSKTEQLEFSLFFCPALSSTSIPFLPENEERTTEGRGTFSHLRNVRKENESRTIKQIKTDLFAYVRLIRRYITHHTAVR